MRGPAPRRAAAGGGWRGGPAAPSGRRGGRTRQAASPLKAATTSPARGPSAHAPRACARPRVPASRPPPRRRTGASSGPGWVAPPGRRGGAGARAPPGGRGAGGAVLRPGRVEPWRASTGPMVARGPVTSWRGRQARSMAVSGGGDPLWRHGPPAPHAPPGQGSLAHLALPCCSRAARAGRHTRLAP